MPEIDDQLRTQQTRIEVDGTPYVLPPLDTFDLDEAMVMYRYSSLTFDQIFELEGLHPGVIAGMLHVAIARSDPALRDREIKEMVGNVNMMNVLEQLASMIADQPDPTQGEALSSEPSSPKSSDDPTSSSGDSSDDASEPHPASSSPDSSGTPDSSLSVQPTSAP